MPFAVCLAAGGGSFAGGAIWQAILSLINKQDISNPSAGRASKKAAAPRGSLPAWSPLRMMSPPTHLRRNANVGGKPHVKVSSDVSLTDGKADLKLLEGVSLDLDTKLFVELLGKLISVSKQVQNNPRLGIVPQEKLAAQIVIEALSPFAKDSGGPLIVEELEYIKGRSNLKVVYPGSTNKTVAFVGSHFDVVPANPEEWDKDPFQLTVEGDKLYGRGTTDCLGHVALITALLAEIARKKPKLKRSIVVLFIAGEEGGEKDVGVDKAVGAGKLQEVKQGPLYWVDSADSQPCCGTSGMLSWSLKCSGRVFHSGFPNKGINAIELGSEVCAYVQGRFYEEFPQSEKEEAYQFSIGSNMKPTQIECAKGSLNQICPECTISGDIRLSPFYEVDDVKAAIERYVDELNNGDLELLPNRGPFSKFVLPAEVATQPSELRKGSVELKWLSDEDSFHLFAGIAVNLDSEGHKALVQACRETYETVRPFSVNGSLPLVRMMQKQGFDVQICGFGIMSVYHGVNEYCTLSDMCRAYATMLRMLCLLEAVV